MLIGTELSCKCVSWKHKGVSENSGTPKSSILIGFSIINHPFWGTTIFGNTQFSKSPKDRVVVVLPSNWPIFLAYDCGWDPPLNHKRKKPSRGEFQFKSGYTWEN